MNNISQIAIEWLEHEDAVNREERLSRLEWLAILIPLRHWVSFHGGLTPKYLYDEAIYCFVYGQFLASILLGLAFVEQSIASILYGSGIDDLEKARLNTLLWEACKTGLISREDYKALHKIRVTRNPLAHFRSPSHPERIERKSVLREEHPYVLIEEDARFVMEVINKLLGHLPLV